MKKLLSCLLCSVLIYTTYHTNGQAFHWAFNTGGGVTGNQGRSIAVDDLGNVYTASLFNHDLGIHKNDALGNLKWIYVITGSLDDVGHTPSMVCDSDGNLYITGSFLNTIDFDPGSGVFNLTATNGAKSYIMKLDSAGHFIWAKMWTHTGGYSRACSIHYNSYGYIVTAGWYTGIMDFDPGPGISNSNLVTGQDDSYVVKLDTSGNFIWGVGFGGSGFNYAIDVTTDGFDNVVVSGYFSNTVDFNPGAGIYNLIADSTEQTFVLKLDPSGNFDWARCTNGIGSSSLCTNFGVAIDNFDNIYTTGYYRDSCDFDPGPGIYLQTTNVNQNECYVLKLESNGNFSWVKTFGSRYNDWANHITCSSQGAVIVTGRYSDTTDFDPGPGIFELIPNGGSDIYLLSLTTNGDLVTAKSIGGAGIDEGNFVITDSQDNIYVTGFFQDTVDFNPPFQYNLISISAADIFTVKFGPVNVGMESIEGESEMSIYPNPTDGSFTISFDNSSSGKYAIYNLLGETIKEFSFDNSNQLHCEIAGPSGVYMVKIQSGEATVYTKIIKY